MEIDDHIEIDDHECGEDCPGRILVVEALKMYLKIHAAAPEVSDDTSSYFNYYTKILLHHFGLLKGKRKGEKVAAIRKIADFFSPYIDRLQEKDIGLDFSRAFAAAVMFEYAALKEVKKRHVEMTAESRNWYMSHVCVFFQESMKREGNESGKLNIRLSDAMYGLVHNVK